MNKLRRVAYRAKPRKQNPSNTYTYHWIDLGSFKLTQSQMFVVAAILFLIAGIFCMFGLWGAQRAELSNLWPSTPIAIVDIEAHEYYDEELNRTVVRYETIFNYRVNGEVFENRVNGRLKRNIVVYYSPDHPRNYVFERGVESDNTDLAFFTAAFFGLLGGAVLVISISPTHD